MKLFKFLIIKEIYSRLNSYFHVSISMDEIQVQVDLCGKTTCDKVCGQGQPVEHLLFIVLLS